MTRTGDHVGIEAGDRSWQRAALAVLALQGLYVGAWALLAPRSFYDSFPGFGRHWVSVDGPYNEHLIRDVGAFFLAMFVTPAAALVHPARARTRLAGLAWLAFAVPHLAYHSMHLGAFGTVDRLLNLLVLSLGALVPASLALRPGRGAGWSGREEECEERRAQC